MRDAEPYNENLFPKVSLTVFPNLFSGNTNIPEEWSSKIQQSEKYSQIEQTEIEESKRLMYVAMTRAKDKMILVLNGKRGTPEPLLTFEQFGFDVSDSFLEKYCDLLGVGINLERLENASLDVEYQQKIETKAKTLKIENKPKTIYDVRHIQPSNLPGGKVNAKIFVLSSCWCDG